MTTASPYEPIPPIPVENPEEPTLPQTDEPGSDEPDDQLIEVHEGEREHDDHPVDTEVPD